MPMNNVKEGMFDPIDKDENKRPARKRKRKEEWVPLAVVPPEAGPAPAFHNIHGAPSAIYEYRDLNGNLICTVNRFDLAEGKKEFFPASFCEHSVSKEKEWRWKAPLEPRPLYNAQLLSEKPSATVILCEGEKAADAATILCPDYIVVSTMGGSNAAGKAFWGLLAKRNVIIWPDADEPGLKYADTAAKSLHLVSAQVRIAYPAGDKEHGWDAADALEEGWNNQQTQTFLDTAVTPTTKKDKKKEKEKAQNDDEEKGGRIPQRDLLLSLLDAIELWHDEDRKAFASIPINNHWENWAVRSKGFKIWLSGRYYDEYNGAIGSQALEDGLKVMEAKAIHHGLQYETFMRVGGCTDKIYLDLCDDQWRAVEVTANGWDLIERPPVKFLRSGSMAPLPIPEAGEPIERLRDFINVETEDDFQLLVAWLVGALRPSGPYPLLLINGQQGSSKSTVSRFLRELIDPNRSPIRSQPRDERDLMVSAVNNRVLVYDNVSGVAPWLSDALCRLATGGGYATRELHSDQSEIVLDAQRPMILNGIPDLASRPDLGDRAITIELPTIPENQRRSMRDVQRTFDETRPGVIGALLDAASAALRNINTIQLDKAPRMADFAEWITAAEPGLGWEELSFVQVFKDNRDSAIRSSVEDDTIIQGILDILSEQTMFKGSSTALLEKLNSRASDSTRRGHGWPKTPSGMGNALSRRVPQLRVIGISAERGHSGGRTWQIERQENE